ncbi:MAG: ArnT family glycosyltransferase [Candidatus Aquicultorales bacterium]
MGRRIFYSCIVLILAVMASTLIKASREDSATTDEVPHIAAAYTYVNAHDYRLNPEHPPLMKNLAGLSIASESFDFPTDEFRTKVTTGQYSLGRTFLYRMGNDADRILFLGRLPAVAITLALGLLVYIWSKQLNGMAAGLVSLLLYAFDPNIIGHGHLVTFDVAISAAIALNLYLIWRLVKKPSPARLALAGLSLGLALVVKFSAPLLFAVYAAGLVYLWKTGFKEVGGFENGRSFSALSTSAKAGMVAGTLGTVSVAAMAVVYAVYAWTMSATPAAVQESMIARMLPAPAPFTMWLARAGLRPFAHYLFGFELVKNHVAVGHTIYALGSVGKGTALYYPVTFLIKSTLPTLLLIVVALAGGRYVKSKSPFGEFLLLAGGIVFLVAAAIGNLQLGIRYLLPFYPLFYIYAGKLIKLIRVESFGRGFGGRWRPERAFLNFALLGALVMQVLTSRAIAPYYISYFNETVGPEKGATMIADSNVDWGQDLKRLKTFVDERGIEKIYVDCFGGGSPSYYLKDKAEGWNASKTGRPRGWFAISVNVYMRSTNSGEYGWLKEFRPVARVGHSILVYKLP